MTVESASYISGLNPALPNQEDKAFEGDNHLRLIKATLKATFPLLTGPVLLSQAQMNALPYTVPGMTVRGSAVTTLGQTTVTIPFPYTPGANSLLVLAEGRVLRLAADYTEASPTTIALTSPLPEGTELDFLGGALVGSPGPLANSVTLYGDVSATLSLDAYALAKSTHVWNSPLTADRNVTLSTTGAFNGGSFRIVRRAAASGASLLAVEALKNLAAGQWVDVEWSGTSFFVSAAGSL